MHCVTPSHAYIVFPVAFHVIYETACVPYLSLSYVLQYVFVSAFDLLHTTAIRITLAG